MGLFLKRLIVVLLLVAVGIFSYSYLNEGIFKKSLSPKDSTGFNDNGLEIEVSYNRPSKRNREVFGALVPFDKVWRTGANEATTFKTNRSLKIGKDSLPAGKYTLWTIPNDTAWNVMFNTKQYKWGVDETMKAMRDPQFDVVIYSAKVEKLNTTVEQFTIAFDNSTDNLSLTMAWDNTKIIVPLK